MIDRYNLRRSNAGEAWTPGVEPVPDSDREEEVPTPDSGFYEDAGSNSRENQRQM